MPLRTLPQRREFGFRVVEFAQRLGIKSKLDPVPSICLGTSDVTLYEMVAAYCSFVNLGIQIEPYYITDKLPVAVGSSFDRCHFECAIRV